MLRLHGILGYATDAVYHTRLHALEHDGGIALLFVPPDERGRRRFRLSTDHGTECAVSLDRGEELTDGALLSIDETRAIVARLGERKAWRLRPATEAAALKLGWHAGNLHWRVRFEDDCLVVLLDGSLADDRARLAHLLKEGDIADLADV